MYLEKSISTATLQHCPARLLPNPATGSGRHDRGRASRWSRRRQYVAVQRRRWELANSLSHRSHTRPALRHRNALRHQCRALVLLPVRPSRGRKCCPHVVAFESGKPARFRGPSQVGQLIHTVVFGLSSLLSRKMGGGAVSNLALHRPRGLAGAMGQASNVVCPAAFRQPVTIATSMPGEMQTLTSSIEAANKVIPAHLMNGLST